MFWYDSPEAKPIGTQLIAETMTLAARKQWLADHLQVRGKLTLDDGAVRALKLDGKSLLPIGVYELAGEFERGEVVSCLDPQGQRNRPRAGELRLGGNPPHPQVAQPRDRSAAGLRRRAGADPSRQSCAALAAHDCSEG